MLFGDWITSDSAPKWLTAGIDCMLHHLGKMGVLSLLSSQLFIIILSWNGKWLANFWHDNNNFPKLRQRRRRMALDSWLCALINFCLIRLLFFLLLLFLFIHFSMIAVSPFAVLSFWPKCTFYDLQAVTSEPPSSHGYPSCHLTRLPEFIIARTPSPLVSGTDCGSDDANVQRRRLEEEDASLRHGWIRSQSIDYMRPALRESGSH